MQKNLWALGFFILLAINLSAQSKLWESIGENAIPRKGERRIIPQKYQTFEVDKAQLKSLLSAVNQQGKQRVKNSTFLIELPMPNGKTQSFRIAESPVMAPELGAKFPEIRTYAAQGIDNPNAYARLDWTPAGFHAMIMVPGASVYIDPHQTNNDLHYISYYKADFKADLAEKDKVACLPLDYDPQVKKEIELAIENNMLAPSGDELRTYRLANAATAEYTQFHGGTVASGQAAIVTAINRVTGIYEVELAIRLELVPNNDLLVYTDPATDPYTNGNAGALLGENQVNCDAVIGNANYDIGHVFSTGGGGLAALGVVCNNNNKARGETGLGSPTGDPFYVDYVAHEMGHQFGGNHTFNGNAGSCAGGNRNSSTAYEPGSGSTIQAYAGICGSQNLQNNSDAYFHTASFSEMIAFSTTSTGDNCPVKTPTNNSVPVPNAGASGYIIPINTPFELTGSATDADGDPLTYSWEEYDLGPAGAPGSPTGNAPIFRSFSATDSPTRIFPKLSDILNNTSTIGEILPSYGRDLTFRLTVRDNRADGGGVDFQQMSMTVDGGSGPFRVTNPNTAVTLTGGSTEIITWDVANTDQAPVSCSNVDILLSTDGGLTFPTVLISGVNNDGSQGVLIPNMATTTARIKVKCSDNVFFDLSDTDFTIILGGDDFTVSADPVNQTICLGENAIYAITIGQIGTFTDPVTLTSPGSPGTPVFSPNGNNTPYNSTLTISGVAAGTYTFDIVGTSGLDVHTATIDLTVLPGAPTTPVLSQPNDGETSVDINPNYRWIEVLNAPNYHIQIARDVSFTNIVEEVTTATNNHSGIINLDPNTTYFWRVRAENQCGQSAYQTAYSFTTANIVCSTIASTDVPKTISASGTPSISSTVLFPDAGIVHDVKVLNLNGTHTWINDLDFNLLTPADSPLQIMARSCGNQNNFDLNLDDAGTGPAPAWPCPPTDGGTYEPSNLFSLFDGQDPSGVWTLRIDDNANQDGGTLLGWSLEVCFEPLGGVPVELINLEAKALEKAIQLDWSTASEFNNKGFEVERSLDPINGFESIGWVAGKQFADVQNDYQFLDSDIIGGLTYYYRLRQVDLDESDDYSPIVSAKSTLGKSWDLFIHPNPAYQRTAIQAVGNFGDLVTLTITDINGRVLLEKNTTIDQEMTPWMLDLSNFAAGIYILRGRSAGEERIRRLVVK